MEALDFDEPCLYFHSVPVMTVWQPHLTGAGTHSFWKCLKFTTSTAKSNANDEKQAFFTRSAVFPFIILENYTYKLLSIIFSHNTRNNELKKQWDAVRFMIFVTLRLQILFALSQEEKLGFSTWWHERLRHFCRAANYFFIRCEEWE